jgi:hypothetical protein
MQSTYCTRPPYLPEYIGRRGVSWWYKKYSRTRTPMGGKSLLLLRPWNEGRGWRIEKSARWVSLVLEHQGQRVRQLSNFWGYEILKTASISCNSTTSLTIQWAQLVLSWIYRSSTCCRKNKQKTNKKQNSGSAMAGRISKNTPKKRDTSSHTQTKQKYTQHTVF